MTTLPLRFRILHYMAGRERTTLADLLRDLADEYRGEGQFRKKILLDHLLSLKFTGLIDELDMEMTGDGELLVTYGITDIGRSRMLYLPRRWQRPGDAAAKDISLSWLECRGSGV